MQPVVAQQHVYANKKVGAGRREEWFERGGGDGGGKPNSGDGCIRRHQAGEIRVWGPQKNAEGTPYTLSTPLELRRAIV